MRFYKNFQIKEILCFLVGGGSAVAIDFIVYILLKSNFSTSMAKTISFILGASVGFVINKLWTFKSRKFCYVEILKYIILYACSAAVNTFVNKGMLSLFHLTVLAFLTATGCSTIINFLGQKFFVFRKRGIEKHEYT